MNNQEAQRINQYGNARAPALPTPNPLTQHVIIDQVTPDATIALRRQDVDATLNTVFGAEMIEEARNSVSATFEIMGITEDMRLVDASRLEKSYVPEMIRVSKNIADPRVLIEAYQLAIQDTYLPVSTFKNAIKLMTLCLTNAAKPNSLVQAVTELAYLSSALFCFGFSSSANYNTVPAHIMAFITQLKQNRSTQSNEVPTLSRIAEYGFFFMDLFPDFRMGLLARKGYTPIAKSGPGFEYTKDSNEYYSICGAMARHQLTSSARNSQNVQVIDLVRSSIRKHNKLIGDTSIGAWDFMTFKELLATLPKEQRYSFIHGFLYKSDQDIVDDTNFTAKYDLVFKHLEQRKIV